MLVLLGGLSLGVLAAPTYPDILPLSQVKPGMSGYGLTVFRGTKVERFGVTVIAVVRNGSLVAPGHDMILVRMSGGPMTTRKANLIRGMSGSPVYIRGKCIGAFSQGEPSTKEPLGGVTPIEDMLEAWDPKLPDKPEAAGLFRWDTAPRSSRALALRTPLRIGARVVRRIVFDAGTAGIPSGTDTVYLRPCATMLTVSGFSRHARKRLADLLRPYGVEVVQTAGGGKSVQFGGASLRPGASFSVMLMRGDLTSGATGTVTYRRGDRFLGFGHPFMGLGPLPAPVCAAYVHDVYPLNSGSYKITTPGPVLGSLDQDRPFCVSGHVGSGPPMIPVTVEVEDRTIQRSKTYRMQVVRHPRLYAGLVGLAVGSAIADLHSVPGPVTAAVETAVETERLGTIQRTNEVYDANMIDVAVTGDLESILNVLASNPFEPLLISGARVGVTLNPGRKTATIEQVAATASKYEPGHTAEIAVTLRPFGKEPVVRTLQIPIPAHCPASRLTLTVQGGAPAPSVSIGGLVFRPSQPAPTEKAPPTNVRQMLDQLLRREAGNEIAAILSLPSTSVAVNGEPLRGLPPTLDAALRSSRLSSVKTDRDEVRVVLPTEWVVSGRQTLTINVEKRGTRQPSSAASPQPSSSPSSGTSSSPRQSLDMDLAMSTSTASSQRQRAPNTPDRNTTGSSQETQRSTTEASQSSPATEIPRPTPVAKVAKTWKHSSAKDWATAKLEKVTVTSTGEVRLTEALVPVCQLPEPLVWCLVSDGRGGAYAGTGTNARVFHIAPDGSVKTMASLPEVSVHALLLLPDGTLLAGTAPHGRTYRIAPDGTPTVLHEANEPYVLALARSSEGSIFIGTGGGSGALYRITPDGNAAVVQKNVDQHILSLCVVGNNVYAGTAGMGAVLRFSADGHSTPLLDAVGESVTCVAEGRNGNIYAVTSPRGAVWQISDPGQAVALMDNPSSGFQTVAVRPDGTTVAAGASTIVALDAGGRSAPLDAPTTAEILCAATGADGAIWIGTANNGQVLRTASASSLSGTLESGILDAGSVARWGHVAITATEPQGTSVLLETRSGQVSEPDASWSSWGRLQPEGNGGRVLSPPARYLQYRLTLTAGPDRSTPAVQAVTVSYLPANRAPTVAFQVPTGGEDWSGVQTLKWQASDPDQDALAYAVEYSRDGGRTWQAVPETVLQPGEKKDGSTSTSAPTQPTSRKPLTVAQVTAELDRHPDLPPALRQEILDRTRALNVESGQTQVAPATSQPRISRETSRSLDTKRLEDGVYMFRVTASDAPSNWTDVASTSALSKEVVICNTPPVVFLLHATKSVRKDGVLSLECAAIQSTVIVTAAQWRLDGGDWSAAAPVDGLADSRMERFLVTTPPMLPGKHTLEVQVFNSAGLSTTEKLALEIP